MAVISEAVGLDTFQQARDNIAAILLDEWLNQFTLTANPDLSISRIWRDRRRAFNLSELPAVNLSIASVNYGAKTAPTRDSEVKFWIDFYTLRIHEDEVDADEASMQAAWTMLQVSQYILDHPAYRDLGLRPLVKHFECSQVTQGETEISDGGKSAVLRLEVMANVVRSSSGLPTTPLSTTTAPIKLGQTEKGYYYQLTNN